MIRGIGFQRSGQCRYEIGSMNWLDTKTQELLQAEPPQKLAPRRVAEYGVVLLKKGTDQHRLIRAVRRINDCSDSRAEALLGKPLPITINPDLQYGDAQLAQFELICCDAVGAILSSEVLDCGARDYLMSLFKRVAQSSEFSSCEVTIMEVPCSKDGLKFADQFLGVDAPSLQLLDFPVRMEVSLKKARIMKHWAERIGAGLECDEIEE